MNTANSPKNILEVRARLGEIPFWHPDKQLLYWADIYNHCVHQFNPTTGANQFFDVGEVVGSIAPAGNNRLIICQRHRIAFLDTISGKVTAILDIENNPDIRFNDGKCDCSGRFWFSSMSSSGKPQGSLYRYDRNGLQVLETGLTISNGLGWSPEIKLFI